MNWDDVTFIIPVRIDFSERKRNLDVLIDYLHRISTACIRVIEADDTPKYNVKINNTQVVYEFIKDSDPVFHRTKYLNLLLKKSTTQIVGIWDTDVIVPENQINDAIEQIRTNNIVMSFPYDGRFVMVSAEDSSGFPNVCSISDMFDRIHTYLLPQGNMSVGGAFLVNRNIYIDAGGENEHFYGWGPEDAERVKRMEILGLPVYRANGPLFHLHHPRGTNSWFASKDLEYKNRKEMLNVCRMYDDELLEYIGTWNKSL